jgi:hypothetical protein
MDAGYHLRHSKFVGLRVKIKRLGTLFGKAETNQANTTMMIYAHVFETGS